jgi:hypothetical protein
VLKAQEYWRLKGLHADVVVINEHPSGYRDEIQKDLTSDDGQPPLAEPADQPGGMFLLRTDALTETDRIHLASISSFKSTSFPSLYTLPTFPYHPSIPPTTFFAPSLLLFPSPIISQLIPFSFFPKLFPFSYLYTILFPPSLPPLLSPTTPPLQFSY